MMVKTEMTIKTFITQIAHNSKRYKHSKVTKVKNNHNQVLKKHRTMFIIKYREEKITEES